MEPSRLVAVMTACALATQADARMSNQQPASRDAARVIFVDPQLTVNGASPEQKALMEDAQRRLNLVLDSDAFKTEITNATFTARRQRLANGDVLTPPNDEILKIILEGRERQTSQDDVMQLNVRLRELRKGTVGSTRLGSQGPISTAYWFVDRCVEGKDPYSMAGHLAHEWMHKAGFTHYPNNSARGDVPYVVGDIVRKLARGQKIAEDKALNPNSVTIFDNLPGYLLDEAEDEVID